MPSARFAAAALKAAAAADAVMAEAWTLQPRGAPAGRPNAPDAADAARWSGVIQGTFVDPQAKPELPNSYDRRETRRPGTESGHPRLLVSTAALAAMQAAAVAAAPALSAEIRQGDHLLRAADSVAWKVVSVFAMAAGTLTLNLQILG